VRKMLFVCVHNAGRSQMAEAFFNYLADGKVAAASAGTRPSNHVGPVVVATMLEAGIDIRSQRPKQLTPEILGSADRVITMGCDVSEDCPVNLGSTEDWEPGDPKGKTLEMVRRIRDEIKGRVEALVEEL
jgi:arsenate reductase